MKTMFAHIQLKFPSNPDGNIWSYYWVLQITSGVLDDHLIKLL